MKHTHALRVLCLVVLSTALFAWIATSAGGASEPVYQGDAHGDVSGTPDVLGVTVSDDHGIVTLTVRADDLQIADGNAAVMHIDTMIDIDRNTTTGDEFGSDYEFEVSLDTGGVFSHVWEYCDARWAEGGYWDETALSDTVTFTAVGNTYTFAFATSKLGGSSGFRYYVTTKAWNIFADRLAGDRAPADGSWTYWPLTTENWNGGGALAALPDGTLYLAGDDSLWHQIDRATIQALGLNETPITIYGTLPGAIGDPVTSVSPATPTPIPAPAPAPVMQTTAPLVKPIIATPISYPAKPVAGKSFRLTFAVTRSDTGGKLLDAKMICDPSVNGKVIRHFEQLKKGTATMLFTVPKAYKGKTLKVHLTIKAGNESTTRNTMFRVS